MKQIITIFALFCVKTQCFIPTKTSLIRFPRNHKLWHNRPNYFMNDENDDLFDYEFPVDIEKEFDLYLESLENYKTEKMYCDTSALNTSIPNITITVQDFPYGPPESEEIRQAKTLEYIKMLSKFNTKKGKDSALKHSESDDLSSENFEVTFEPDFNFSQVGGYDLIKQELLQVSDVLSNYDKYKEYNIRLPKGVILEGPPGNGKTILTRALSGELSIPFIACSGSEFQERYVGVGASRIRELFDLANRAKPCIIFIDEIDAIARKRGGSNEGSDSERDNTLNELLTKLDGFKQTDGIFMICATNRIDLLDNAFLRPGRIDKKVFIGNPDAKTREEIIKIHIRGKPHESRVTTQSLVEMTNGQSGAEIENLLNEAMLFAIRDNRQIMTLKDIEYIQSRNLVGFQATENRFSESMIQRIAVHELGHAISGMLLKSHSRMKSVHLNLWSPRSPGYTVFETDEIDANIFTNEKLMSHLVVLLSGRIAEDMFFNNSVTTGATRDFEEAHKLSEQMVINYGMGRQQIFPYHSDKSKEIIDQEVCIMLDKALYISRKIIFESKSLIQELIPTLIEEKILSRDFIMLKIYRKYNYLIDMNFL